MDSPFGLVQAPNRFTTFRWFPMWIRIFSSDIKALCSLAVAPSVKENKNTKRSITHCWQKVSRLIVFVIWSHNRTNSFRRKRRSEINSCVSFIGIYYWPLCALGSFYCFYTIASLFKIMILPLPCSKEGKSFFKQF